MASNWSGEFQVGYEKKIILRKGDDVLVQAAQGAVESLFLEASENLGDVSTERCG